MAVESVLKAWVFLVYHFWKARSEWPGRKTGCLGQRDGKRWGGARSTHAGNGRQGYSFGWTNGGTEDIL